jgi:hypothetical protein
MAKRSESKREASLRERAASRGYELVKEGDVYFAAIGDTRFGPLADLDAVEEFIPGEG